MARRPTDSPNWGGARPNSGSKPKEPIKMKAYYLPVRLVQKLAKKAAAAGVPPSKILAEILETWKD